MLVKRESERLPLRRYTGIIRLTVIANAADSPVLPGLRIPLAAGYYWTWMGVGLQGVVGADTGRNNLRLAGHRVGPSSSVG